MLKHLVHRSNLYITQNSTYKQRRAAKFRSLNFLSLFRDLQKPTRFGGGGVVAHFFPGSRKADARDPEKPTRLGGGGGVVAAIIRLRTPLDGDT